MKKQGKFLDFISQIGRDGKELLPISEKYINLVKNDYFDLTCLSVTEGTWIASGFNSYVVKLKKIQNKESAITVKQLIDQLSNLDPDLPVYLSGVGVNEGDSWDAPLNLGEVTVDENDDKCRISFSTIG